jgi:hypothetical protein
VSSCYTILLFIKYSNKFNLQDKFCNISRRANQAQKYSLTLFSVKNGYDFIIDSGILFPEIAVRWQALWLRPQGPRNLFYLNPTPIHSEGFTIDVFIPEYPDRLCQRDLEYEQPYLIPIALSVVRDIFDTGKKSWLVFAVN